MTDVAPEIDIDLHLAAIPLAQKENFGDSRQIVKAIKVPVFVGRESVNFN